MTVAKKIEEAQFFLELLDALDERHKPLTHIGDTAKEASFLFAAVLNSFYSAIAIMRDEEGIDVSSFVGAHPEIYARAKNGGERAKTVHVAHTDTAYSGYISPMGNEINFDFRKTPLLLEESRKPGRADFVFGPHHYMHIELYGKLVQVTQFCHDHFYKIRQFHAQNQPSAPQVAQQSGPADSRPTSLSACR
jgi:hypothetical protein